MKEKKRRNRRNKTVVPPHRRRGGTRLKKNELEKKNQNDKNTTTCKQSKTKNQWKNDKRKEQADQSPKHPPGSGSNLWYAWYSQVFPASKPGTLLPRQPSPPCVRQLFPTPWRKTIRNKQSWFVINPPHTTPSLRLINRTSCTSW